MMPHPEGLRVTPEMARQQMDALKRMQPDQLENLAAMAEHGGPPDAQRAAEMLKASTSVLCQHATRRDDDARGGSGASCCSRRQQAYCASNNRLPLLCKPRLECRYAANLPACMITTGAWHHKCMCHSSHIGLMLRALSCGRQTRTF